MNFITIKNLSMILLLNTLRVYETGAFSIAVLKWFEPIHVRQAGPVRLSCRNQIIQYDIEMKEMTSLNKKLAVTMQTLDNICDSIQFNHICTFTIDEIKFLSNALINKSRYVKAMNAPSRKYRLIDEIGNIIQKTITLADNSYGELRHSLDELQSLINHIGKSQNKILEHLDYVNFNSLAQITILNLKNFSQMYDSIMDIFFNGNYKRLVDLIPIENLRADLRSIQKLALNESCEIPVSITSIDLAQLLSIFTIDAIKTGNIFSIKIKISTAYEKIFELVEAISIPFLYQNRSYLMQPVYGNYLMYTNETHDAIDLIPFTLEDKLNCKKLAESLLCNPQETPIIMKPYMLSRYFIPNPEFCGNSEKLSEITSRPQLCNVKLTLHTNHIIRLSDTKYYIYVVTPANISIQCIQENFVEVIKQPSFIMDINSNCSIGFGLSNSYGRKQTKTNVNQKSSYVFPIYAFTHDDLIKKEPREYEYKQYKNLQPEYGSLQEDIQKYNREQVIRKTQPKPKSDLSPTAQVFIILAVVATIILGLFILYKVYYRAIRIPRTLVHMNTLNSGSTSTINI